MATINLAEYQYTLSLDDSQYTKQMGKAEQAAESMKSKLSSVGGYLKTALTAGLAAAGVAVAATLKEGIESAAELEEQMSKFQSSTGATAEEVEQINELAKELYKSNTDSMEDIVATSSAMMTQMGVTVEQVEALQQSIMDFAKTTGMSNTDVVSAVDDIGDAWKMTAEESVAYLDVLKASSEQYGTDVSSVVDAITACASAASALGLSIDEVNGYMNLFADSGLEANQAITALNTAAKNVESPEAFREMVENIQAIEDPTQRAQAAVELFGSKAGIAMANVLDGTTALDDYILTVDECAGTVANASAAFDSNFNVQLELLKKQFSGLALEIGEKVLPVLNTVLGWITDNLPAIFDTVSGVIDGIVALVEPFIVVIRDMIDTFVSGEATTNESFEGIRETISTVIGTIQEIVQKFVELFKAIWEEWGEDIVRIATEMFQNALEAIQHALDQISDIIDLFISILKGDWQGAFDALKNIAADGWELVKSIFNSIVQPIVDILSTIIRHIADWASDLASRAKEAAKNFFDNIINTITSLPGKIYDTIKGAISKVASWGSEMLNTAINAMKTLIDGIVHTLSELSGQMIAIGGQLVQGIWNGISDQVGWVLGKIRGFGDQVLAGIKSIFGIASPSKLMRDEVGKYLAQGIGVGFEDEMQDVNKQIRDAINTQFDVDADVLTNLRSHPAYKAAAVETPSYNTANDVVITYGDIVIEGNATQETVQDITEALQQNAELLYNIVYSANGLKVFDRRYNPTDNMSERTFGNLSIRRSLYH